MTAPAPGTGALNPFQAATRDLLAAIADGLDDAAGADDKSAQLIALMAVRCRALASYLATADGYPDLPGVPLSDVTRQTAAIRKRLAEITGRPAGGGEPDGSESS